MDYLNPLLQGVLQIYNQGIDPGWGLSSEDSNGVRFISKLNYMIVGRI